MFGRLAFAYSAFGVTRDSGNTPAPVIWDRNNSSRDWTLSNNGLTANRGSTAVGFWAMLRANNKQTNGTFAVTVDAIGSGLQTVIGFDTGVETQFPGQDGASNSFGYVNTGAIVGAGTTLTTVATYTTGDIITCVKSGSTFTFKKNGVTVYGPTDLTGALGGGAPVFGAVYPAASNGNGTGTQLTLDPTGWGSTDVTVALTGQSLTNTIGSLLAATALALTGGALAGSQGSVAPQTSRAVSGQSLATAQGSSAASVTVALTGQSLSAAQGSVVGGQVVTGQSASVAQGSTAPATSVALTGQSLTAARGSLAPATAEALIGQSLASAQGTPIPGASLALTGQSGTVSRGTLAPASSFALSGQSIVVAGGTVAPANAVSISGQSLTVAQGTVTVAAASNVTAALTGQSLTGAQGSVAATISVALSGQSLGVAKGLLVPAYTLALSGQTTTSAQGAVVTSATVTITGFDLGVPLGSLAASIEGPYKFYRNPPLIGRRINAGRSR